MDAYDFQDDYDDDGSRRGPRNLSELIFNIGTLFFLIASACLAGYFLLIFLTPQSPLNFFPPDPAIPVVTARPSATPFPTSTPEANQPLPTNTLAPGETPIAVQPTVGETSVGETPVGSPTEEVPEATLAPTDAEITPLPTPTDFVSIPPTPTDIPPISDYSFVVQEGSPVALTSEIFRPEYECNVSILAGQVFKDGAPLTQQNIVLYGPAEGSSGIQTAITGREDLTQIYGPAAFEFILDDQLIATQGLFSVQLVDQNNNALSQRIYFDTYDNCDENVVMINFVNIK